MSRDIAVGIDSDLDADFVIPMFFVELDWDTDPVYLHTDIGDITVLAHTWIGTGGLGSISPIEETVEQKSRGIKMRLDLTNEAAGSIFEELTTQDYYQRTAIVYFSTRNTVTGALGADPFELFRGKCDVAEIEHGFTISHVDLLVENEWADGNRSNGELFSDAQLQSEYTGDLGFEFLNDLVNRKIVWGSERVTNLGAPKPPSSPFPGGIPNLPF